MRETAFEGDSRIASFGLSTVFLKLANAAADADEFAAVFVGEELKKITGFGEAGATEFVVNAAAFVGHGDVDTALVLLIELAVNEGFVEVGFEGADDAGHLGGEDVDGALEVADGERAGVADDQVEGEVLGFGEVDDAGVLAGGDALLPTGDGEGEDFLGHLVERIVGRRGQGIAPE
jgi:hypothetical protein